MPPQYSQGHGPQPGMGFNQQQQQHSSFPSNMQQGNNNNQQQQGQNQMWGNQHQQQPSMNQQNHQNQQVREDGVSVPFLLIQQKPTQNFQVAGHKMVWNTTNQIFAGREMLEATPVEQPNNLLLNRNPPWLSML